MSAARENLPPQVIQRVARELRRLVTAPLDGIRYVPQDEEQLSEIHAEIRGPEHTPYEGGFFRLKLVLSDGFPLAPPRGLFLTKIFHPNIAATGDVCVNTLKKDWSPALGIAHVLQVIRCLLIVPFPESALNDEAGRLFMDSYDEYARRARLWTAVHAPKQSAAPPMPEEEDEAPQQQTAADSTKELTGEKDADPTSATAIMDATGSTGARNEGGTTDATTAVITTTPATPVKRKDGAADPEDPTTKTAPQTISAPSSTSKKRASSDATDLAKKKSAKKKGIKRL